MCGRYLVEAEVYSDIWKILANIAAEKDGLAKGEVFPTNTAPVITAVGAEAIKWGFPKWKGAGVIINARAETALDKNMFRKPLLERRCVIPSSGFFEWDHAGGNISDITGGNISDKTGGSISDKDRIVTNAKKKKDKYLLRRPGERVLYMAGMVNQFRDADGIQYNAFVILTTAANEWVAPLHDRMPVILAPDERDRWLTDAGFMEHALSRAGPELSLTQVDIAAREDNYLLF